MKIDLRQRREANKRYIFKVLYRFYQYLDNNTGEVVDAEKVENEMLDSISEKYEYDETISPFDIKKSLPIFTDIVVKYGAEYLQIELDFDTHDGYTSCPQLVGKRLETDKEYDNRVQEQINKKELEKEMKEKKRQEKEKMRQEKERKLLNDLRNKYGSINNQQ